MGCPSNSRFSIVDKYYWWLTPFSPSLGQWNIVNGLGALCCVPHCFSLNSAVRHNTYSVQKALPTSTLQFLGVRHHIALHCIAHCSCQWGPPAGGNEADECICHTELQLHPTLHRSTSWSCPRQLNFFIFRCNSIS